MARASLITLLIATALLPAGVGARPPAHAAVDDTWSSNATAYRGQDGSHFTFTCPKYGTAGSVWGTDVYTDDSSACTAAVHAGLIKVASGGKVTIQMLDGQSSYRGSKRNGVASQPYGPWGGSYFVVDAPGGPDDAEGFATGNVLVNGQPFSSGLVPYGATVDVTGGTLSLTAKNVGSAKVYGDGTDLARFVLKKSVEKVGSRKRTTAELALTGGDFGSCGATGAAHAAEAKVVRALWGTGKGRFRTKGRFASATIRGTAWLTSDRCDGTLTTVQQGAVVVRDFTRKKSVTVSAGKSYLAPSK